MIPLTLARGKHFGVFGLARSGIATIKALRAGGGHVVAWDDGEGRRGEAEAEGATLAEPASWPWPILSAVILSPGVPLTHPEPHAVVKRAQAAAVDVIGDIELFQREIASRAPRARLVAITGTNGKSTTTALTAHLLKTAGLAVQMGGNIGRAVLDLEPPTAQTVYVLEISSYQIDLAPSLAPDVAVLLNITPDHLDRHGSMAGYVAVKRRIFKNVGRQGTAVICVDDSHTAEICTRLSANGVGRVVPVSVGKALDRGVSVIDGTLYDGLGAPSPEILDLRKAKSLPGTHNWQNAAAAYAAARAVTSDVTALARGLQSFPGLKHRMEDVGRIGAVRFINDSKATNADAAGKALACYDTIYWIAGGIAKEGGIETLARFFPRIARAYLIGKAAGAFAQTLQGHVPFVQAGSLTEAVTAAYRDGAQEGRSDPVVLLSPACASFDQFRDFEDRGEQFKALVERLREGHAKGEAAA